MGAFVDRTGQRYGMLEVISRESSCKWGVNWRCRCDCGKETIVAGGNLTAGRTTGCGCRVKTQGGLRGGSNKLTTKKGATMSWVGMMRRCYSPSNSGYHRYGGRGITVCERWHHLPNFLADMGEPPTTTHSLDRIDNMANYTPENCRWATKKEQAQNKRDTINIEYGGKIQCVAEWSRELGIPLTSMHRLIRRKPDVWKRIQN